MANLTFQPVTVNNSFNAATLDLTTDQMNGIIQLIQASGITPSIPLTADNLLFINVHKMPANADGVSGFQLYIRTSL